MGERWNEGPYFKRRVTLNYLDCDTRKKVFLHYMMGVFSEIAGDESISQGQTHKYFVEKGSVFLITRMSMRFHRVPTTCETIVFSTWYRKAEGRFFLRDCDVRSESGELLASGSGTWVLLDLNEGFVINAEDVNDRNVSSSLEKSDSPECIKVLPETEAVYMGTRPIYYTDLDCNYHMNNSVYSRIATDFLPPKYQTMDIKDAVINFNKETKLGDTLEIFGSETENGYIIQGLHEGVQHFAVQFWF